MTNRSVGRDVLEWLDQQRLPHTPSNYETAHSFVTQDDAAIHKAISEIIDGGVRIKQSEMDSLSPTRKGSDGSDERVAMRMIFERLSSIASSTERDAGNLARDLGRSVSSIDPAIAPEIVRIATTMIERAETAERSLAATRAEADQLRQDLEAARDDAQKDALTGLANRRALEKALGERRPGSLAFIDLDHFKSFNDRFGHSVGDRVLKLAASELAETCVGHLVARWGGEGFCIHFEGLGADEAKEIVDLARLRLSGRSLRVRETNEPIGSISFSAGISSNPDWNVAVTEADGLLYEAKGAGRGRTHI